VNTSMLVLASSSLAITFLAFALAREVRWRRGLQQLLARLLARWRTKNADDRSPP